MRELRIIKRVIERHRFVFDPLHLYSASEFFGQRVCRAAEGKVEDRLFFANLLEALAQEIA